MTQTIINGMGLMASTYMSTYEPVLGPVDYLLPIRYRYEDDKRERDRKNGRKEENIDKNWYLL